MKALEAKLEEEVQAALAEENQGGNPKRAEMSTPVGKPSPTPRPAKKRHCTEGNCPAPTAPQLAQCEEKLLGNDEVLMLALQSKLGQQVGVPSPLKVSPTLSPMKLGMSPLCPRRLNETPTKDAVDSSQVEATQIVHTPAGKLNKSTAATPATILADSPSPYVAASDDPYSSSSMPEAHAFSCFLFL